MPQKRSFSNPGKHHSKTRKHAKRLAKKANLFRVLAKREYKNKAQIMQNIIDASRQ